MFKNRLSIEIVISTNKRLSSMSLTSRDEIKRILSNEYDDVQITEVNYEQDLDLLIARKPDLVFLGMKYIPSAAKPVVSAIWLSQRLVKAGIPHTGSSSTASRLEHNKHLAKQKVSEQGLATASSQLIKQHETYNENDIRIVYPIFIKPVDGGGGSGINEGSLVHTFEELKKQVDWLTGTFKTDALLEGYLNGREFSVGVLRTVDTDVFQLFPLEIVAPRNHSGARFLSSRIKRADAEQTSEISDENLKIRLNELALNVFEALGAKDYGRIDIRMDAHGKPHFLEANLLPSLLNNYGNLPKAALMNANITHTQLVLQIANLGLNNQRDANTSDTSNRYNYDLSTSKIPLSLHP